MEARTGGVGHWRRWNGAEWNRLELAKPGPSEPVSLRLIGGSGGLVTAALVTPG